MNRNMINNKIYFAVFLNAMLLQTIYSKNIELNFYPADHFAQNITYKGQYIKRFRLCNLTIQEYKIPLYLEFFTNPKTSGEELFWKFPLLTSHFVPTGKNKLICHSITGRKIRFTIPSNEKLKKGEMGHSIFGGWTYKKEGKDTVIITSGSSLIKHIFEYKNNHLVKWKICQKNKKPILLYFKRDKFGLVSILEKGNSKPILKMEHINHSNKKDCFIITGTAKYKFLYKNYNTILEEELGPVSLLSSIFNIATSDVSHFYYKGFNDCIKNIVDTQTLKTTDIKLYNRFSTPEKKERKEPFISIESEGNININLVWNLDTGFPVFCDKRLCFVEGNVTKKYVKGKLRIIRAKENPERWEMIAVDWQKGKRFYENSKGYKIEENTIFTHHNYMFLKPRISITKRNKKVLVAIRYNYSSSGELKSTKQIK